MTFTESSSGTLNVQQSSSTERMAGASASGVKGDFVAETYHDESGMTAQGKLYDGRTEVYGRDQHLATELSSGGQAVSTEVTPHPTLENPTDIMPVGVADEVFTEPGERLPKSRTQSGEDVFDPTKDVESHDGNSKPKHER